MKKLGYIILFFMSVSAYGQLPNGSYTLIHTQTARTYEPGRLEFKTNMNFYTKLAQYVGDPSLKPSDFKELNAWVAQGNIGLTYGIVDHLDFTLGVMVYQDTQTGEKKYNAPDNISLMFKLGNYAFAKRMFMFSGMLGTRFFTGEKCNYSMAFYQSGGVEYGLSTALTFFSDPYLPERAFSASLNLGWWNHNDAGRNLRYGAATVNAQEFQYGVGLVYPTEMFDFMLEFNGMNYLVQPDSFVYSRDNWMYLSPSMRYKAFSWMSIDLGFDYRLSSGDFSSYLGDQLEDKDMSVYPDWKVQLGLNFKILPIGAESKTASEREREVFNKRVDYFQNIIKERDESENIEKELENLKEERKQAEQELEELKQILQEEGN
jgi:hypothetical protein